MIPLTKVKACRSGLDKVPKYPGGELEKNFRLVVNLLIIKEKQNKKKNLTE